MNSVRPTALPETGLSDIYEMRRYRRPTERWVTMFGGVVIVLATAIPLASYLAAHSKQVDESRLLVALLCILYVAVFAAYFFVSGRVGVETSIDGVMSVSLTSKAFVDWSSITQFIVDRHTSVSVCVTAERCDGTHVSLRALTTWRCASESLYPYRDALNAELRARRVAKPVQGADAHRSS
jgi:hypothetical protein